MSNHCGPIPNWITTNYLQKVLESYYGGNSISVKNFQVTPGSAVGDNYIGQVVRLQVDYSRKNRNEKRSIIAKFLPKTDLVKEFEKVFDVFAVEMKMMSETLPLLYDELTSRIESERFFPYSYHSDINHSVIFMEDLVADGYVAPDRKLSLDLDHVLLVVKAMAKMHASSHLLFQKNPAQKGHYLEWFWKRGEGCFPTKLINGLYTYVIKYLHLYQISEEDKNIFRSFDGKIIDLMSSAYERKDTNFNVLLHGDVWTTNMMFKYENEKVKSVKLVDYQVACYCSFGLDLNYFLFTSAMEYVKINHLDDVFQVYYDTFVNVTGAIEGFSVNTVREEFKKGIGFGFTVGTTVRCMMTAEGGFDLDALVEGREAPNNDKMFQRKDFISELVNLLPIFKEFGVFK